MTYHLTPLDYVVLLGNIVNCEEANYGVERTKTELITALNTSNWKGLREGLFEEALYCCNMNNERGEFYHPLNLNFKIFLSRVIPIEKEFDMFWNLIKDVRSGKKEKKSLLGLGDHSQSAYGGIGRNEADLSES